MEIERALNKLNNKIKCLQNSYYDSINLFPKKGIVNKLYIDRSSGTSYIWNGSGYITNSGGGSQIDSNIIDALDNANNPSASNIFLTEDDSRVKELNSITYNSSGSITINYTDQSGLKSLTTATNIIGIKYNVLNYSELLTITSQNLYDFAYVREEQGTKWLPGSLGGTFYNKGLYIWNGTTWEKDDTDILQELNNIILNKADVSYVDNRLNEKADVASLNANLILYPTTTSSDIATYYKMVSSIDDTDYDDTAVDVATPTISTDDVFISALASDVGVFVGNTGVISISIIGNIKKISGVSDAVFYFEIYKRDNLGVETLLATSGNTIEITTSVYEQFFASALLTNTSFMAADRVVYKFYGSKSGVGSDSVYDFQFGGAIPVRSTVPIPIVIPSSTPNKRLVNETTSGTFNIDHSLYSDWKLTLTGATTLTDSNLPNGDYTIEFTMKITGSFGLTLPSYWSVNGDTYDGTKWNFFAIQVHKGDGGSEEVTVFITNLA